MRQNPAQRSFSAGEVSPLLYGREDYQRVQAGLRVCRGFIPLRQGGVTRAPGTIRRGATRGNGEARLIPFQFAEDDAVVLEFGALKMRVWRYGALVMSGASPYELTTPYDMAAVRRLKFVQSADAIYLVDGQSPAQRLVRAALDDWAIAAAPFERGPFEIENDGEGVTVQASAETGAAITLTGVGAPFVAGHVGGLFRLRSIDDGDIPLWEGNKSISVGDRKRYDGRIYEAIEVGSGGSPDTGVNPPTHVEGTAKTGNAGPVWRYISDLVGIVRITAFANANSVTARVIKRIPQAIVDAPTFRWSEGAWSTKNGWPGAIALHQQRLWLAATRRSPRGIWASAVGGFRDFEPGVEADDSFGYTISGISSLNRIVWLQAGARGLHVGALGEEYSSGSAAGSREAIGPTSVVFELDGTVGSAPAQPIAPDGKPILIARDRARVFEMRYAFEQDRTQPVELSLPSEHLGAAGFAEIAWQGAPMRLAWLRRSTGDLAVMVHDAAEDVLGWATLPLAGGIVESVAVTTDATGEHDVVTLVVRREIGGETVRWVEELAPIYGVLAGAEPVSQAVHLFASTIAEAPEPFSVVSGLDHLEGETVHVWTDRGMVRPKVVAGGAIALEDEVRRACVGLFDDTHLVELLDVPVQLREGSATGRQKRVKAMGLRWHRTTAAEMCAVHREFGRPDAPDRWVDVANRSVPADLVNGWSGVLNAPVPSGWTAEVSYRLRPVGGAPMTLLSATAIAEAAEG